MLLKPGGSGHADDPRGVHARCPVRALRLRAAERRARRGGRQRAHRAQDPRDPGGAVMATTLGPKGRRTKPLTTPYSKGDKVVMLVNEKQTDGRCRVGDTGTIRRIFISDPHDGDETFLLFAVTVERG